MNIKKIRASNFLSYDELEVNLDNFNVLIGPNASGKSNFVTLFQFIKNLVADGLSNAISIQGGYKFLRNLNTSSNKNVELEFELEFEIESLENDISSFFRLNKNNAVKFVLTKCHYFIEIGSRKSDSFDDWIIIKENLNLSIELFKLNDIENLKNPKTQEYVSNIDLNYKFHKDGKSEITYNSSNELTEEYKDFLDYLTLFRFSKSDTKFSKNSIFELEILFPFLFQIRGSIEEISIYHFNSTIIKEHFTISGKTELEHDGRNLATVLSEIFNDSKKKKEFLLILKDFLPFINNYFIKKRRKKIVEFGFKEIYTKTKEFLPANLLSDGTIDITIYIIILFFEKKPFIIIEEPCSNIHPYLISKLINMMKDVCVNQKRQIIITTHNPELVKYAGIDNLYVVKRDKKGFSDISKPKDKEEIKKFLKNNLGVHELFIENLL